MIPPLLIIIFFCVCGIILFIFLHLFSFIFDGQLAAFRFLSRCITIFFDVHRSFCPSGPLINPDGVNEDVMDSEVHTYAKNLHCELAKVSSKAVDLSFERRYNQFPSDICTPCSSRVSSTAEDSGPHVTSSSSSEANPSQCQYVVLSPTVYSYRRSVHYLVGLFEALAADDPLLVMSK